MDPVSAVGIAAASLQFLDFTSKVLLSTARLWNSTSNVTARHEALQQAAERLDLLTEEVQNQCSAVEAKVDDVEYDGSRPLEIQLWQISEYCHGEAETLQRTITSIARRAKEQPSSLWNSFRIALRSELDDGTIKQLALDIEAKRKELDSVLLACMWAESKRSRHVEASLVDQLRRWNETVALSEDTRRQFIPGPQPCQIATIQNIPQKPDTFLVSDSALLAQNDIANFIWSKRWQPPPENYKTWEPLDLSHWCHQAAEQITQSLDYEAMNRRHEAIPPAYQTTFEWIWGPPPDSETPDEWSSFPAWLEDDTNNFYWISGKPGSGKSTLMKYLESHPSLRNHLDKWRPSMAHAPLRVLGFFAWNSGSDIQKSTEGLMRTLLRQAVEDMPDILPAVAPRHWEFWKILKRPPPKAWDYEMLEESFGLLLSQAQSRMRMFVFIDGLDEFDVPPKKLIQVIDGISRQGGLKICVASRPWYQFSDFFSQHPGLEIHRLTLNDMETFVSRSLAACVAFSERASDEDLSNLVTAIPQKAQGVFLWVAIVVRSVVVGLERGDPIASLVQVVRSLPSELSTLFDDIWSRIPSELKKESAQLFLLRLSCFQERLHYILLWAVEEWGAETNVARILKDEKSTLSSKKTIARRVSSRTHGLLEVQLGLVDYLHRTVEEWAGTQNFQEATSNFNTDYAFLKTMCLWGSLMTQYGGVFDDDPSCDWASLTVSVLHFARRISHGSEPPPPPPPSDDQDFVAWLIHFEQVANNRLLRRFNVYIDVFLSSQFSWNGGHLLVKDFLELAVMFLVAPYITRVLPERRDLLAKLNLPLSTVIPGAGMELVYKPPSNVRLVKPFRIEPHDPGSSRDLELRTSIFRTCLDNDVSLWGSLKMPEAVEYVSNRLRARIGTSESTVHDLQLAEFLEQYSLQAQRTKPLRRRIKRILGLGWE